MICPTGRLAALAACLLTSPAAAGVILTADVYDTPGLPGYQTFDLTASSPDGYLGTFGFYGRGLYGSRKGISGPLYQGGVGNELGVALGDRLYGDFSSPASDSRWLIDGSAHLSIGAKQSSEGMYGAFAPRGDANRNPQRNLPFARLVTNDPSAVRLNGEFVVDGYWSDGGSAGQTMHGVDTLLSDVTIGAAPVFDSFPDRPAPLTPESPPAVSQPVADPPAYVPPVVTPPASTPTSIRPYDGPMIAGPDDGLGLQLTANVYETPGLPGHQTFDISVTAFDGYVNAFGFYGDEQGIHGPLRQGGVDNTIESLFADRLFDDGSGAMTDSRWLVDDAIALTIGADQSADGMTAAYAIRGDSGMRDTYRTLPLARLVTDDPSAVRLTGEFVVDRVWDDGTEGGDLLYEVDYLLSDILVGDAPTGLTLPTRPTPPVVETPVETPVVEDPPHVDPIFVVYPPTRERGETGPVPEPPMVETPPVDADPATGEEPTEVVVDEAPEALPIRVFPGFDITPVRIDYVDLDDLIVEGVWVYEVTDFVIDPTDLVQTVVWSPSETNVDGVWLYDRSDPFFTSNLAHDSLVVRGFANDLAQGQVLSLAEASDSQVPEPTGMTLLGIVVVATACRRRGN